MEKNKSILQIATLITIVLILLAVPSTYAQPVPTPENYKITFISVTYDEATNSSTWTYNVTCFGPPAISHIDFEFKTCDPPLTTILDAGPDPWEIVNPDPTTNVIGLKFDTGVDEGETLEVWFTLEGLWAKNDITVWVKAGHQEPYEGPWYIVEGPACFVIPEVPLGSVAVLAAAFGAMGFYANARRKRFP